MKMVTVLVMFLMILTMMGFGILRMNVLRLPLVLKSMHLVVKYSIYPLIISMYTKQKGVLIIILLE